MDHTIERDEGELPHIVDSTEYHELTLFPECIHRCIHDHRTTEDIVFRTEVMTMVQRLTIIADNRTTKLLKRNKCIWLDHFNNDLNIIELSEKYKLTKARIRQIIDKLCAIIRQWMVGESLKEYTLKN